MVSRERGTISRFNRLRSDLLLSGKASMRLNGTSMEPLVHDGHIGIFQVQEKYEKGDIVFCRIGQRYYVHKITAASRGMGYQISNNHGFVNGWTKHVYGKLVETRNPNDKSVKAVK